MAPPGAGVRAPLRTARDLLEVIREAGVGGGRRHDPATLVFQALRIVVVAIRSRAADAPLGRGPRRRGAPEGLVHPAALKRARGGGEIVQGVRSRRRAAGD